MTAHPNIMEGRARVELASSVPQTDGSPLALRPTITVYCIWCRTPRVDIAGRRGRPRLWCNAGCRNKAYRARLIMADTAGSDNDNQGA